MNFNRFTLKPVTLSDKTHFPQGVTLTVPAGEFAMDPKNFPEPKIFDGFRFYKLRQASAAAANLHQFASVDSTSVHWGYGRHACPGRHFASQEIKCVLAMILKTYDIRLLDPQKRPENWSFETQLLPNMSENILMKRRKLD